MSTLILMALIACVPKAKYEALEVSLAEAQATLAATEAQVEDLESALADEQAAAADLEAQIAETQARLADARKRVASLTAEQSDLEASVQEMEQALVELSARKVAADARVKAYRDLLGRFQSLIDAGKLKVHIVDGRMVVELATDVLFASGSASLSSEGKDAIVEVSGVLAGIPDRQFQVAGHTDDDPISTAQYPSNWELASARATTVVKTMVDAGMPAERVSASSFAEFQPVASNEEDDGKSANRRIEIVVVPDLSDLPGYDELNAVAEEGEATRGATRDAARPE